jgi:hypothetical protein
LLRRSVLQRTELRHLKVYACLVSRKERRMNMAWNPAAPARDAPASRAGDAGRVVQQELRQ